MSGYEGVARTAMQLIISLGRLSDLMQHRECDFVLSCALQINDFTRSILLII